MKTTIIALVLSIVAAGAHAQTLAIDPHLDLPKSAEGVGWSGLADPTSQFDLVRARRGGLSAAAG